MEKDIEEGLDHKTLRKIKIKYYSDHRYELVEEPKNNAIKFL